ncbi:MAG: hypothetical protein IPP77_11065 [Bacteroidetes bacterium]|nr:hypothetical protein [Bacteroidota bacterium]
MKHFSFKFRTAAAFLILTCLMSVAQAQTTYTWAGSTGDSWAVAANWTPTRTLLDPTDIIVVNTGGSMVITAVPTQTIGKLQVTNNTDLTLQSLANYTLTIANGTAANDLDITSGSALTIGTNNNITMNNASNANVASGASLTINSGRTFSIAATIDNTMTVDGTLNIGGLFTIGSGALMTVNGTVNNLPTSSTISVAAVSNILFTSGAVYDHQRIGGTFLWATWDANSEAKVTGAAGVGAPITQGGGQNFGKFTWNTPGLTGTMSLGLTGTNSAGTFDITSTGSGIMSFSTLTQTLNLNSDLNINGTSTVSLNTGAAIVTTLTIPGDLNIAAGATFQRGTATGIQLIYFNNPGVEKDFNNPGSSFVGTGISIIVNAGAILKMTNDITGLSTSSTFTVNGTLRMSDWILSGTGGAFTLGNAVTAVLEIGHAQGISTTAGTGNVQVTGTKTYGASATLIYNGTVAQVTGNGLAAAWGGAAGTNIVINNASGVTLTQSLTLSNGTLVLQNGNFTLGANNLTLSAAAAFSYGTNSGFSASNMVITDGAGQVIKQFPATAFAPFTFPVGENTGVTEYSPVMLEFVANSQARSIGVRVVDDRDPKDLFASDYLTRYWLFTNNSNSSTYTLNADFTYLPADVVGTQSNLRINRYSNVATDLNWTQFNSTVSAPVLSMTGITNVDGFLPASPFSFDVEGRNNVNVYYRSTGDGNWNDVSKWEVSSDPLFISPAPVPAIMIPNNLNSEGIEIKTGTNITVNVNTTADDIKVVGTLTLSSTTTLTVANGVAAYDMVVTGTVVNSTAGVACGIITPTGVVRFESGGIYEHAGITGTIPAASWDPASTCLITGSTTAAPAQLTQAFGNFSWNCNGQTATIGLAQALTTVNGNLDILNTGATAQILSLANTSNLTINVGGNFSASGTARITLNTQTTTSTTTMNVAGNFNLSGTAIVDMRSAGTTGLSTLSIAGNYNQTGGTFTHSTGTGVSTLNLNGAGKTYTQSGGTVTNTLINYNVNSATADVTLNSPITLAATRTFNVIAGGILRLNGNDITFANAGSMSVSGSLYCGTALIKNTTGATTFTLAATTGTLGIGSAAGITQTGGGAVGNIQVSSTRNFGISNYIYNGSVAQVTGTGLPVTVNSLTIDNSDALGVTLTRAGTTTSNGNVNLLNGRLYIGGNTLFLAAAALFTGTYDASTMIVADGAGQVIKTFPASYTTPFIYPIGDASGPSSTIEYSPVTLTYTVNPAMSIGVRVVNASAPSLGSPTDYLTRHWVFTGGTGTYTYNMSLQYPSADIVGTEANLRISRYSGGWLSSASSATSNVLSSSSILTNLTTPLTTIYTGRESSQLYYRSIASGDYNTNTTWETATDPGFTASVVNPAAAPPTSANSVTVQVQSAHIVTLNGATGANIAQLLNVDGVLENKTTGVTTITTTGGTYFNAGSEYRHSRDGGSVPTATWDPTSLCNITGITSNTTGAALSGIAGVNFGKFTYNSSGQTVANVNLIMTNTSCYGDFTVESTGGNAISFLNASSSVNLRGDLIINGGTLSMNSGAAVTTTLNLYGNYNQSGGTFQRGSATAVQAVNFMAGSNRTYTQSGGTINPAGINYTVNSLATLTLNSGMVINTGNSFVIAIGGALYMKDNVISGAGTFTLSTGALTTLGIGHTQGISTVASTGNVQTTTKTYGPACNYVYNNLVSPQVTGNGLPASLTSTTTGLTIDNPTTVTLSQSTAVSTTFNLNQGQLILGNFDLTLSNTNNATAMTGAPFSVSKMIITNGTGQFKKSFTTNAQAPFIFPVGETTGTTEYSPVTLEFTATNTARTLGVRVVDSRHPNDLTAPDYLTRHWLFTNSAVPGNYTLNADFTYSAGAGDVFGTEANLSINRFNNVGNLDWAEFPTTVNSPVLSMTGITQATGSGFFNAIAPYSFDVEGRKNVNVYYRTVSSGNWTDVAKWEVSSDPTFVSPAPVTPAAAPNSTNSEGILISSGDDITLDANTTVDNLVIEGILRGLGSNRTLTLVNGIGDDLTINAGGELRLQNNGTPTLLTPSAGTVIRNYGTIFNQGTISLNAAIYHYNGSVYEHNINGGAIPAATLWDTLSTCKVTGMTTATTLTGVLGVSFGHFIWNNPGQTYATPTVGLTGSVTRFKGNFTLESTGAATTNALVLCTTTGITAFMNGDLILNKGTLNLNTGSVSAGLILRLAGNYSQTGANSSITATGTFTTMPYIDFANNGSGGGKTYTQSAGTVDNTKINYYVNALGTGSVLTLNSDINLQFTARTFIVSALGTLYMGAKVISGVAGTSFQTLTTATLGIGHVDGIVLAGTNAGNVQTAARTFSTTGTYIYNGSAAQVTGTGLPPTVGNLIMDNSAGGNNTVDLTNNLIVSTTLTLNQGLLKLANNNLTLNNSSNTTAVLGNAPSNNNMIVIDGAGTGQLIKYYATGAQPAFTYPVGEIGGDNGTRDYSPATLTFSAVGTAGTVGVRVINDEHASVSPSASYLHRYWDFTTAVIANYTYAASFGFAASDVQGTLANINAGQYRSSTWYGYAATNGGNTLTVTDGPLTNVSAPLALSQWTGRETTTTLYYRTKQSGNWNNATTWQTSTINANPWIDAVTSPNDSNSLGIYIRNGHVVTVTSNVWADQISFDNVANSTLKINSGITFTLKDGTGNDLSMVGDNSRLMVNGIFNNEGIMVTNTVANTFFSAGSQYEQIYKGAGAAVPLAAWDTTATCLITGLDAVSLSMGAPGVNTFGVGPGYGHIVVNNTAQTGNLTLGLGAATIKGNFTMQSSGSGELTLQNSTNTIIINGNLNIQNGTLGISGFSGTSASTLNLMGNFNQTGGVFSGTRGTATGVQTLSFIAGPSSTYTQVVGTINTSYINFIVQPGASLTLNDSISLDLTGRTFTNSGTLVMSDKVISGVVGTSFTNTSAITTTLNIGSADGITAVGDGALGNIQTGTTRSYGTAANYIYNGTVAQVTGSGLVGANKLTINNAANVTQQNFAGTAQSVTVTDSLIFLAGTYQIGGASAAILNTLVLNGKAITPLATTGLLSTAYSNLTYGPGAGNVNTDLYIPSSISDLNSLSINVAGTNTVTQKSNITLNSATTGLTLTSGRLVLGSKDLILTSSSTAAISGGSVTAMVVADGAGQLKRTIPVIASGTNNYIFPIGDLSGTGATNNPGADYSPVTLNINSNSDQRIVGIRVTDDQHPSDGTAQDYISRYWTFTDSQTGTGTYNYLPTFQYSTTAPSDLSVPGTHASLKINRWNGAWNQIFNTTGSSPTITPTAAVNETNAPLGGNAYTGRVNAAVPYVWQPNVAGSYDFQDAANWLPNRLTAAPNDILQFTKGGTSTAINVPAQVIAQLFVKNNTDVTFEAATVPAGAKIFSIVGPAATSNMEIESGSTLQMGGTVQLTLNMLTNANQTASIAGTLVLNNNGANSNTFATSYVATTVATVTGAITNNGGIVTGTATTLFFANGSSYNHNMNGGAIPIATYYSNPAITTSTVNITGTTTTNPTWPTGNYSNVVWNNAGQTTATGQVSTVLITVNGDLTVSAGRLWGDNATTQYLLGNATGTFTIGNGATYKTTRSVAPFLPTFDAANMVLADSSIILYGGATHIIPNNPTNTGVLASYGVLAIENNVLKTLAIPLSVKGLQLNGTTNACILSDGGNLITGPGSGMGTIVINVSSVLTLTNTNANPFPEFKYNQISSSSTVNYNTLTTNQNIRNLSAPGYGFVNIINNAGIKSLTGDTYVQGTLTVNGTTNNTILDLNGNILYLASLTPITVAAGAKIIADASGSTLHFNSASPVQNILISGTIENGLIQNMEISTAHPNGAILQATPVQFTVNNLKINTGGTLSLNGRTLNITGSYTNNGNLIGNAASSILAFTGTSAQSFNIGNYTASILTGLTINNAAGVTLGAPTNITTLTLTNGLLNTSAVNLPTVVGTAVLSVAGGSATAYVNGPLERTFPASLASGSTYTWPIGKGSYNPFSLINARTMAGGLVEIKAEAFDANAGGTPGIGLGSLATNRYWETSVTANAGNLIQAGNIQLTETSVSNGDHITFSATKTGTYNLMSSAVANPLITTNGYGPTSLGFLVLSTSTGTLSGTYTVGTGGDFTSITNAGGLFDVINAATVAGNLTANIISDINIETGSVGLNEWAESPSGSNYTFKMQSSAAVLRTVEGGYNGTSGANTGMIRLNGADRVTIDGSIAGSGQYLLFRNNYTSTWSATLSLVNGAKNNLVTRCILEGGTPFLGLGLAGTDGVIYMGGISTVPVAPSYSYESFSPTYTPIDGVAGTTNLNIFGWGLYDETDYNGLNMGFNFNFGGNNYSTFGVNTNGYIYVHNGSASPPASGGTDVLAVPSLGANVFGVMAPLNADLDKKVISTGISTNGARMFWRVDGSAPNRYLTVQWSGFYAKVAGAADDENRLDFQARLYENGGTNSNNIEFIYRDQSAWTNSAAYAFNVGIRGLSSSDFNNRTQASGNLTSGSHSAGALNTDNINFNAGDHIAGDVGIRYKFAPLPLTANDNNTFSYLDIRSNTASGSAAPVNGFYASGSATYPNNNNTITNSNIYNFDWGNAGSGGVTGIKLLTGTGNNWNITNNNIYRSSTGGNSLGAVTGINFAPAAASTGSTISGNFIGGTAPGATGNWPNNNNSGLGAWTGITLNVGAGTTNVTNNTIRISTAATSSTAATGISYVGSGTVNIGNGPGTGNTISDINGVGGITVYGIDNTTGTGTLNVNNNTISNISSNYNFTGSTGAAVGIKSILGIGTVNNNTISALSSTLPYVASNNPRSASVIGMWLEGNQNASGNTISNLSAVPNGGATGTAVTGIFWRPTTINSVLEKNFIHSFNLNTTDANGLMTGIAIGSVTSTVGTDAILRNNMIRLGIDNAGASLTQGYKDQGY